MNNPERRVNCDRTKGADGTEFFQVMKCETMKTNLRKLSPRDEALWQFPYEPPSKIQFIFLGGGSYWFCPRKEAKGSLAASYFN